MNGGPARVLDALRRASGQPCSGEALSARLGVSRAQVWKDVQTLRSRGYVVEGARGDGYQLTGRPDRLYPEEILPELETRWLARDLRWLERTDSTNRVAQDLAREGAAHGTTVVAEEQTGGRGRLGRRFYSPPFTNLYSSTILRPRLTTAEAPTWILAAAIAVADAVAAELDDPEAVEIKWPNDVLVGGRKVSGILMELGAEATRVAYLVLGIGVNLNVDPASFPAEFRARATSISSQIGRSVDRVGFARRLYTALESVLDACATGGFAAVRPRFESRFRMVGRGIRVHEPGLAEGADATKTASEAERRAGAENATGFDGIALGIDTDGALRVQRSDGTRVRVVAADVTLTAPQEAEAP